MLTGLLTKLTILVARMYYLHQLASFKHTAVMMLRAGITSHAERVDHGPPPLRGSYQHFILGPIICKRDGRCRLEFRGTVHRTRRLAATTSGEIVRCRCRRRLPTQCDISLDAVEEERSWGEDADVCNRVGLIRSIISPAAFGASVGCIANHFRIMKHTFRLRQISPGLTDLSSAIEGISHPT